LQSINSGGPESAGSGESSIRQIRIATELEGFYRQLFLPLVRRASWKYRLSKEDARDVVQDAFVLAVVKLKAGGNGRVWLMRTVDQLAINFRRKGARRARLQAHWLGSGEPSTGSGDVDSDVRLQAE